MKIAATNVFVAAAMLFGTVANAQANKIESIAIGTQLPAPTSNLRSVEGKSITLAEVKTKKGLIVMFSCNTCPYVVKSQERTKEVMAFAKEKGIGMVIVNSNAAYRDKDDSYEAMKKYAKEQDYTAPYVLDEDSKVADAFGATRTPEVYLFDKESKLVYKGALEDNPGTPSESKQMYLQDAAIKMMAGQPASPSTTKSVGCGIKRAI